MDVGDGMVVRVLVGAVVGTTGGAVALDVGSRVGSGSAASAAS
jgi:hypothetical protein